jgi:4-oxalmesaconate hydratase
VLRSARRSKQLPHYRFFSRSQVGPNNVLYAAEPYGTAKNTDPRTGKPFDETIDFITDIDWLTTEEKSRILDGNALRIHSRISQRCEQNG